MSSRTSFAASRLINPPGATPVLTEDQVWKGLGIKARNPKTFVPMITSSEVVSDVGNKALREVRFNNGDPVRETIELHPSTIVNENEQAYFEMESTGIRITNIVSYDANGELVLTFSFANGIPGGVAHEGKSAQELNETLGKGVEHSVERIRELAVAGEI
ncbi:hypothetical protein H0H87_012963 [Tephrocybe sp. NHM501043]|nr:hypothetical protein H0H87_012963 [Tephrocybe sp. NHM501043]